jgi:hypothetical protein
MTSPNKIYELKITIIYLVSLTLAQFALRIKLFLSYKIFICFAASKNTPATSSPQPPPPPNPAANPLHVSTFVK